MDHPPLCDSGSAVHALYDDLLRAMRRGHARPGARPLEAALVELWHATSKDMSRDWRRRFMLQLEAHRDGCAEESVNRRIRHVPTEAEYAPLRRRACGPFLYDLVEPVLGVELPTRLLRTPRWKTVADGVADVVAWSNDLASHDLEAARGDVHDLPAVLSRARGLDAGRTAAAVAEKIVDRLEEAWAAARRLPEMLDRLELTVAQRAAAAQVVKVLLDTPRAHMDWLAESGRYEHGSAQPGTLRLDALASLRQPPRGVARRGAGVQDAAAHPVPGDEAARAQHAEVLADRARRHAQPPGQVGRRGGPGQRGEQLGAARPTSAARASALGSAGRPLSQSVATPRGG